MCKEKIAFLKSESKFTKGKLNYLIHKVVMRSRTAVLIFFALSLLSGCASMSSSPTQSTSSLQNAPNEKKYSLSEEELKLDCRKLTGRTQVRIMASRGADLKDAPSAASQTFGFLANSLLGSNYNSVSQMSNDRLILEAYNKRLGELGCKSFDLDKELANRPSAPTPEPTIEEKSSESQSWTTY